MQVRLSFFMNELPCSLYIFTYSSTKSLITLIRFLYFKLSSDSLGFTTEPRVLIIDRLYTLSSDF